MAKSGRGSTAIICVMYVSTVVYVIAQAWYYKNFYAWFPTEVTALIGAVFVAETVSLARLRMAKEQGRAMPAKQSDPFLSRIGADVPDFEEEVQRQLAQDQQPKAQQESGQKEDPK